MKHFIWLLIFFQFVFINFAFGQVEESFTYDDKGRRDPFLALVDETGQYLLEEGLFYSPDELNLSGILCDPQGRSSAIINNEIVKEGESIYGFTIKNIVKDRVILSKSGKEYIIQLSIEKEE